MILFINTASTEKIQLALKFRRQIYKAEFQPKFNQTENLLAEIDRLFTRFRKLPQDLKGIVTVIGPGPYTALRVGTTIANTLAYSLKIPVVGFKTSQFSSWPYLVEKGEKAIRSKKPTQLLIPYYGKEPNITNPKS